MSEFDTDFFRTKLIESGKSQADLSRALNMDRATVHNLMNGKRRLQIADVNPMAEFLDVSEIEVLQRAGVEFNRIEGLKDVLEKRQISIVEIDHTKGAEDLEQTIKNAVNISLWKFPESYVASELKINVKNSRIMEIQSDSMSPTLNPGDRVIVNLESKAPSPPGIFIIWDGLNLTPYRLESKVGTFPLEIVIKSDREPQGTAVSADKVKILGRVVWVGKRI